MNRFPAWLNTLVLVILLTGILFALPNIYGSAPAIQLADADANPMTQQQLENFVRTLEGEDITPEAFYLREDRAVIRFLSEEDQQRAADRLRARYCQLLDVTLDARPAVYMVWICIGLMTIPMYSMSAKELAPKEDQGILFGIVDAAANSTLDQTSRYTAAANDIFF